MDSINLNKKKKTKNFISFSQDEELNKKKTFSTKFKKKYSS